MKEQKNIEIHGNISIVDPKEISVNDPTTEVLKVRQYIGMILVSLVPGLNVVFWKKWLKNAKTNKNKKNFVIANIIISLSGYVLTAAAAVSTVILFKKKIDEIRNKYF